MKKMTLEEWRAKQEEKAARKAEKQAQALKWFTEEFLPSLEARATNPKYPRQVILTEGQLRVCERYMTEETHRTDYGYQTTLHIKANGKTYGVYWRGRYTFLIW